MRKPYLIIGVCCLISLQALPQDGDVYASTHKPNAPEASPVEPYSLKKGLRQLEVQFNVSIAYKDQWVKDKVVQKPTTDFTTVEQALDELLSETDLYYEKAGSGFYVISLKNIRKAGGGQSASLIAIPDLPSNLQSSTEGSLFERPLQSGAQTVDEVAVTVAGTVSDEAGSPVPGVNVLLKGTAQGTATDAAGKYSISVPDESAVLVFSFIGYATQEVTVGSRTTLDVTMKPDVKALEEVVVTALGIEKSSRGLGYSTSKVTPDQFAINRTPNIMNSLQGKIAGVSITTLGTGPAGTSKIRIRGQTSISGQNNPLIVINGVPMDSNNFGSNPGNVGSDGSYGLRAGAGGVTSDGGDGLLSINPDDVESMTVLKGAAASALYGSRANNGVIMITTKSKGIDKGIGVTYNMNYTANTPLDYTDWQYEYGQGENGLRPTTPNPTSGQWSFGEKITPGMTQILYNNLTVPYVAQKGILSDFYRVGNDLTNTVSVAAGSEKGGMNFSVANLQSNGITPNNTYSRKTINLGINYDLSDRLNFRTNINYSFELNNNPPNVGNQDNTIPTVMMAMANTMPLDVLKANMYNAAGNEYIYSRFMNRTNPYFTLAEQFNRARRDRVYGNFAFKYELLKWLSIQGRLGEDFWSRDQEFNNFPTGQASLPPAPAGFVNGQYTQDFRRFRETNIDFLISGQKDFGKFGINFNLGGNQMKRRRDQNNTQVTDFVVRGLYTVQNGRAKDPIFNYDEMGVNSLYGAAEVNFKKFIYLNATIRNDWFSTLSANDRSILYPSVSAGYVFSESFGTKPSWLSFAKLRAAYAEVGSDGTVAPYSNVLYYGVNGNLFGGQPVGNFGATIPNANLRPMRTAETEIGLELKLFNSRVNLDLAAYRKLTTDQIVQAQVSDASGFTSTQINSGQSESKGIEILVNVVPFQTNDFRWDLTFAGAYNITKVLSLLTDKPGSNITVGNHVFNGSVQQIVGKEMGQIVGFGYRRDATGQKIYDGNGIPLPTTSQIPFGSALPRWVGGLTNAFEYKGIMLSFLIDFKLGGKLLSGTNFNAYRHGLHKVTLQGREGGIIGEGVNLSGAPNTVVAPVQTYWSVVRSAGLVEPVIYDAGYVKLRQLSIGYDFTKFFPANGAIKGVKLNFVASNLFMIKKWVDNIDPESFGYTSDNLVGMESPGVPSTRNLGFNLNVKF